MELDELCKAILSGDADENIDSVVQALSSRKRTLAARLFDELEEGDRVRVRQGTIKPVYLQGALATVMNKRTTKITIQFDDDINDPYGKWAGNRCICSPSMLEKVA